MTDLQEVSLFSGIGGISRGIEAAGVHTALLCEYDKHARKILGRHYPDAAIHNDVTELTADDCRAAGAGTSAAEGRVVGILGDHAHTLTAEGHDASEDGTGRGTPVIAYAADQVSTLQAAGGDRGYRVDAEAAAGGHLVAYDSPDVIVRRLTPLELERLQGFPDGWTDNGQADTHRSKQLGNSVAVPVFEWVGRRLVAVDNHLGVSA